MNRLPVLVFGATGYTGQALVSELVASKVFVIAHIRADSPKLSFWKKHFQSLGVPILASFFEIEELTHAFNQWTPCIVYSLIGTTKVRMRQSKNQNESYESIDYGLNKLLIESLQRSKSKTCFIYLSALGTSPHALGTYLKTRWKTEQLIRQSGLTHVIIRAPIITGLNRDDKRHFEYYGACISDAALKLIGLMGGKKIQKKYSSTTNKKLAHDLILAAETPQAKNKTLTPPFDFSLLSPAP